MATLGEYIMKYARYCLKETNSVVFRNKKDYLKIGTERMIGDYGAYVQKNRMVEISTLFFEEEYPMYEINRTIVHEFGHAVTEDCFNGCEFLKHTLEKNSKQSYIAELFAEYFEQLAMNGKYHKKTERIDLLGNMSIILKSDANPFNIINDIFPFRNDIVFNLEGLRKINLEDDKIICWLSNITGKSLKEIRNLQKEGEEKNDRR